MTPAVRFTRHCLARLRERAIDPRLIPLVIAHGALVATQPDVIDPSRVVYAFRLAPSLRWPSVLAPLRVLVRDDGRLVTLFHEKGD